MKEELINNVLSHMQGVLDWRQMKVLKVTLQEQLSQVTITECDAPKGNDINILLDSFISAKKIEGCSDKSMHYYKRTIELFSESVALPITQITTMHIRDYLVQYQNQHLCSKVTIDNMRRILSSFFAWLEDEDYIVKSPVRRIHKVKTESYVKDTLSDEDLEKMRDSSSSLRDLAMLDLLISTGIRVGELVGINRNDLNFQERQCVVFGKGNKERLVYFNARAKIHLEAYLRERTDDNPALFVSLHAPFERLQISGVERRIKLLGAKARIKGVHPHKFRRTMATMAIDKGMPIEQVQRLLGHVRIDTTLHYAMVNQTNVKLSHRKYLG
jgi:site-specific recombinase XerD